MAINPVKVKDPGSSGGGGVGKVIGTALGGIAGFLVGGPPGAAAGASLGGTAGGTVGGLADKGKQGSDEPVIAPSDAISRRLAQSQSAAPDYSAHSAALEDSLRALHESGDRGLQEQYGEPLFNAYTMSKKRGMA